MPALSIVTCVSGASPFDDMLDAISQIARKTSVHLSVVASRTARRPMILDGSNPFTASQNVGLATFETESRNLESHRATFNRVFGPAGAPDHKNAVAEWIELERPIGEALGPYARACDLVVAGGARTPTGAMTTVQDEASQIALLGSGRLALFVSSPPRALLAKVLIAWNDDQVAARAIGLSRQLLALAGEICLLIIEAEPGTTPCNQVLAYLRRHNPAVSVRSVAAHMKAAGPAILEQADDWGATMLIMGAYGHSRTREIVFGGTTRFVADNAQCPVAMAV